LQTLGRIAVTVVTVMMLLGMPMVALAFPWGENQELVTINDTEFTIADYRHWWQEWREKETPVPESPDEFIDWMLLYREAQAMQLDQNPEYLKKVGIFLKVRSLMQLKQEEIGAHTQMPGKEALWEAYLKEYTPLFNLRMVAVGSEEQVGVVKGLLAEGKPLAEVVKAAGLETGVEEVATTGLMRARKIPEPIRNEALTLKVGQTGGPVQFGHAWYFFEILERNDGTEEDFEKVKDDLIRQALKVQENDLTRKLTEALAKKYQVTVDEELLGRITAEGFPKEDADKTVLRVANTVVSVGALHQATAKEQELRGGAHRNAESFEQTKQRVVSDAIAQTVTGLEAIDRHYENQPPLQFTYDFYRQHRMIKELEKAVVQPAVKVDEQVAKAYYEDHPELFSRGGLVEVAVVETNEAKLAEELGKRLKAGEDFFTVMRPLSPAGVEVRRSPVDHLQPVIQEALAKMSPGQVSGALKDGEDIYFVKLIRTGESERIPFEKVSEQILAQLREERFAEEKNRLVKELRSRSTIKVDSRTWDKLKKTLAEEGEAEHGS